MQSVSLNLNVSFQHVDIAALLIKYNTCVNAVDRWGFTPLHEASQKGRTQLCSLLVSFLATILILKTFQIKWTDTYENSS